MEVYANGNKKRFISGKEQWHDEDGLLTMSIYDFLLDEKSLDI